MRTFSYIIITTHCALTFFILGISIKPTYAKPKTQAARPSVRTPATTSSLGKGSQEVDKPLKVQGQSRNLNMMLMLRGEKDKIRFGEVRENYKREIHQTNY